jgi:hypothetical protein
MMLMPVFGSFVDRNQDPGPADAYNADVGTELING